MITEEQLIIEQANAKALQAVAVFLLNKYEKGYIQLPVELLENVSKHFGVHITFDPSMKALNLKVITAEVAEAALESHNSLKN